MRTDIHLFIGEKEVEFSTDPKILFNFKLTELNNPTITKNSWTKQVSIPSTPANDDIFNHFWNLERTNYGVDFNAMVKAPFSLYINGTLVQNGYCKLDSVKVNHNAYEYAIHLYGGIGDYLYNLSYNDGSVGNEKKTLGSLIYVTEDTTTEPDLNFTINKDAVSNAWTYIGQPSSKWDVINFAPCYNGIPEDFDANKVLINNRGSAAVFQKNYGESGVTYRPVYGGSQNESGYSLGETSEEMTCDETFDLRSYLQRPVVNVQRVLKACFHYANNGGYQVKLDSHFFNDNNPYWTKGWVTLPMLRDLEVEAGQTEQVTGASIQSINKNRKNVVFSTSSLAEVNNVKLRINVGLVASAITGNASTVYTYYHYENNTSTTLTGNKYVKNLTYNGAAIFMLVGRDRNGVIVAKSKAYCLSSSDYNAYGHPVWNNFSVEGYPEPDDVEFVRGKWRKINGVWKFCNMNGDVVDIEFSFPSSSSIATLEIATQTNSSEYCKYKLSGMNSADRSNLSFILVWSNMNATGNTNQTNAQVMSSKIMTEFTYNITSFYADATDYESLFSNTYIPKERLLSTSYTPAEFLLSYCKMFGLYIYRNPSEEADDTTLCPKGCIHIYDRDSFYTEEFINLNERIDRSKTMTITPTLAGSKWYLFDQDPVESDAGIAYKRTYGYNYGRQLVNTNYNFDNNTTNLLDNSVFKSGIMVREKDKYFAMPYRDAPIYAWNGMKYSLFAPGENGWDDVEIEIPTIKLSSSVDINSLGLRGYDCMTKLQCHSDNNSGTDGAGVLLFYRGKVNTLNDYWITDDVLEMQTLNDGNACWLICGSGLDALGNTIGIKTNNLPHFTRDLINFGLQEGYIVNSWNFGHPQVIFSPNTYTTDGDSIYDKVWANYMADLYSQDGKKIDCYVNFKGIPENSWLRKYWFFDNGIYALWEIKDFNLADPSSVQCTFVKIQDVNNYKLNAITDAGNESIVLSSNRVPYSGGTLTGQVILQSGGHWFSTDSDGVVYGTDLQGNNYYVSNALRPHTGQGQTTNIQVVFPQSSAHTEITWNVCIEDDYDNSICTQVVQEGDYTPYLDFAPESKNVEVGTNAQTYVLYFVAQNIRPNSVTASSNSPEWVNVVSVDEATSSITLSVSASTMGGLRTALITINGIGINGAVVNNQTQFKQQGSDIDIDYDRVDFNYNETGTNRVRIITSSNWTATINDSNGQ